MNSITAQTTNFGFALAANLIVTWAYTILTSGDIKTFWGVLSALLGVRVFETLGGIVKWRLFGKKFAVQKMLEFYMANHFPLRKYSSDSLGDHLARIESEVDWNNEPISPLVKRAAKELEALILMTENHGILIGARFYSAAETAFDIYSPRSLAKELEWTDLGREQKE